MKVQLIVVQGKPEGKTIPLAVPIFRIGRGEGCQLRPNNEQVSRVHCEIEVQAERVVVRDAGSRNGTFVNSKKIEGDVTVQNGDLIQVGPLTFAVSIQGAPVSSVGAPPKAATKTTSSLDDVSGAEIESWLVGDANAAAPDRPSGVYTGETQTFTAYKGQPTPAPAAPQAKAPAPAPAPAPTAQAPAPAPTAKPSAPAPAPTPAAPAAKAEPAKKAEPAPVQFDRLEDEDGNIVGGEVGETADMPEEMLDESNPFYVAKKKQNEPEPEAPKGTPKPSMGDTSKAAEEVLRKLMERRRAAK